MLLEIDGDSVFLLSGGEREEVELRRNRMLDLGSLQLCVLALTSRDRIKVTITAYRDGSPVYIAGELLESHYDCRISDSEALPVDLQRIAEGWTI